MSRQQSRPQTVYEDDPEPDEGEPLLGLAGGGKNQRSWLSADAKRRIFVFGAFSVSVLGLFPVSLKMVVGDKLRNEILLGACLLIFVTFIYFSAKQIREENAVRQAQRDHHAFASSVLDSTYRCVQPQILGSLVVFPVRVLRRNASSDRILTLDDEILTVELSQNSNFDSLRGADRDENKLSALNQRHENSDARLKALLLTCINGNMQLQEFTVKVFSGASGGPTGLAVGVSCSGYGAGLASRVGRSIEQATSGNRFAPPPSARVGISGGAGGKTE